MELINNFVLQETGEDKANPMQAWTAPKNSRGMWLTDFKTIGT
jgi:hypothetical protein